MESPLHILTSINGGVAKVYVNIPQMEHVVVVHLCLQNATTWRNRTLLPSKACKVMAILQVHQIKELTKLHKGNSDLGLMQKLCMETDFAL